MTNELEQFENFVDKEYEEAKAFFAAKVVPAVEDVLAAWTKQFSTDFGKAALAAAATAVTAFATQGLSAVPALAEAAGAALMAEGISIAEADAQTVLLNAARTVLNSFMHPVPDAAS